MLWFMRRFVKLEIINQRFYHGVSVLNTTSAMIKVLSCFYIKMIPITFYHFVFSKFIMVPRGKNKMSRGVHKCFKQSLFIFFSPSIIVVNVSTIVRRIAIN